jgi:hypothetical protein
MIYYLQAKARPKEPTRKEQIGREKKRDRRRRRERETYNRSNRWHQQESQRNHRDIVDCVQATRIIIASSTIVG